MTADTGISWFQPRDDERLPLLLLGVVYGLYFFLLLLGLHLPGGISEAEEWRLYVLGWLLVPGLAIGSALATWRLRQRHHAEVAGFYPALLTFNTLFWTAGFGFFFFAKLDQNLFDAAPAAVVAILVLYPLGTLAVLKNIQRLSRRAALTEWCYFLLPLAALLVGVFSFSEIRFGSLERVNLPWPVISSGTAQGDAVARGVNIKQGAPILQAQNPKLTLKIVAARDERLQMELPWEVLEGAVVTNWAVKEGEAFAADQPLLTLANERVEAVVSSRAPGVLDRIFALVGVGVKAERPLYTVASEAADTNTFLIAALLAALLAFGSILHPALCELRLSLPAARALDAVVVAMIGLAVINPEFSYDSHHYNFFLGPVNDLLHGKSMLVDINCQYGVGVIYFLALVFKTGLLPFSYQGLAALIGILQVGQYSLVYLLLRRLLNTQAFAVLILGLILLVSFFSQLELAALPSIGPLRFGLVFLLLCLPVLRSWRPSLERASRVAAHILVGVAAVWSVEVFAYVLATHLGMLVWAQLPTAGPADFLRKLARELRWTLAAVGAVHLLLALDILTRSGQWPHWDHYLDYLALYSVGEFGTLPIDPWTPWALIIAVYFVSVLLLVYLGWRHRPGPHLPELGVVAGLTTFGLAQFTYYLGRSHPNNLYHVCIPSLMLAAYWLGVLMRRRHCLPPRFWPSAAYTFYCFGMLQFVLGVPFLMDQWGRTAAHALVSGRPIELWASKPTDPQVEEAVALIERYMAQMDRVPLFIAPNLTTEALIRTGKIHLFPMSNPEQDELVEAARDRALNFAHGLKPGDLFFMSKDQKELHGLQRQIIKKLNQEFTFLQEDTTAHMVVVRLQQR
ncbi:MAG: hypothetical protein IT369_21830 [Candidatus Latescibacteria bacterium]|nr:hypothetical protein [Candidatus Latescibacterota bacterium]